MRNRVPASRSPGPRALADMKQMPQPRPRFGPSVQAAPSDTAGEMTSGTAEVALKSGRSLPPGQDDEDIVWPGSEQHDPMLIGAGPPACISQQPDVHAGMLHVEAWAATGTKTVAATISASAVRRAMPILSFKRPPHR